MNKKSNVIGLIAMILLALALVGGGVTLLVLRLMPQPEEKVSNKANVEWYDEEGKEFVISTEEELYGLVKLSDFYDFTGQTIKLDADIVINEGQASEWAKKAPKKMWYPIKKFNGTFDGQGHTISGVYASAIDNPVGLFAWTMSRAVIKDFKLVNSYFEQDGGEPVGGVAAYGSGTFEKIYSDAIVTSNKEGCGGLIGVVNKSGNNSVAVQWTNINNCWFDGEVHTTTSEGRYCGGLTGQLMGGSTNIRHCLNTGTVTSEYGYEDGIHAGGFSGALRYSNDSGLLTIEDSLSVGKIDTAYALVGSAVGRLFSKTSSTMNNVYVSVESCEGQGYFEGGLKGNLTSLETQKLTGYESYKWTALDFDNYWSVALEGTPVLKYFTDEHPSLEGITKSFSMDWYNEEEDVYVLDSLEDFIGYMYMAKTNDFAGKTLKLGADIVFAEGKADDWARGENLPYNKWMPTKEFGGTFDGQGHTISGLYCKENRVAMGLFTKLLPGGTIKNVKLVNSYFENEMEGYNAFTGSVVGRCEGNLENIYSSAIVQVCGQNVGGLVGTMDTDVERIMKNCWFAGTLNMENGDVKWGGGLVGSLWKGSLTIEHCLNTGNIYIERYINGMAAGVQNVGGFLGLAYKGTNLVIKDSLAAGIVDPGTPNSTGRPVAGEICGNATIENVYYTKECMTSQTGYGTTSDSAITGTAVMVKEAEITGMLAKTNAALDYQQYWQTVAYWTPVLKAFIGLTPSEAVVKGTGAGTVYTIKTVDDLYKIAELAKSDDFSGDTIKLANDIAVNKGKATDWANGKNLPSKEWVPIGTSFGRLRSFQGTFDGQGHTISGLYTKTNVAGIGLFRSVGTKGVVKNLRITNSYFENTNDSKDFNGYIGSVAGKGEGRFENLYSDAYLVSVSRQTGGIIGGMGEDVQHIISNCWFDGIIKVKGDNALFNGGIVAYCQAGDLSISNCLFSGDMFLSGAKKAENRRTGAILGTISATANSLNMNSCLASGTITKEGNITFYGKDNSIAGEILCDGKVANVYISDECGNSVSFWSNTAKVEKVGVRVVARERLLGNLAKGNTALSFRTYWQTVTDDTPILRYVAQEVPSEDYDWTKKEIVLKSLDDFLAFAEECARDDFKDQTIKLGADIIFNSGNAEEWAEGKNLPQEVWSPIGGFAGTFDGQGYTIKGLYINNAANDYMGLFNATKDTAVIKNFKLINSYFKSTAGGGMGAICGLGGGTFQNIYADVIMHSDVKNVGGIVGYNYASANKVLVIENCWSNCDITTSGFKAGGILGNGVSRGYSIKNCLNSGNIHYSNSKGNEYAAGIVGSTGGNWDSAYTWSIENCLNTGNITTDSTVGQIGGIVGEANTVPTNLANLYYLNVNASKAVGADYQAYTSKCKALGVEQILGETAKTSCMGFDFSNIWATIKDGVPVLRQFVQFAGEAMPDEKPPISIRNQEDFNAFVEASKADNFIGQTIKLETDIVINNGNATDWAAGKNLPNKSWTPIKNFAGTFDGNGHSITGLYINNTANDYMGFFRQTTDTAVIKNLEITNSYFKSTSGNGMGVISGLGAGTFQNIYTDVIIHSGINNVGGVVGYNYADAGKATVFEECWSNCDITTSKFKAAGILGNGVSRGFVIKNCLNSGDIYYSASSGNEYVAGILGSGGGNWTSANIWSIENCLNTGNIMTASTVGTIGAIVGEGNTNLSSAKNLYYSNVNAGKGVGGNDLHNTASKCTALTIEQLTGDVATENCIGFDFHAVWTAVAEGVPVLKTYVAYAQEAMPTVKPAMIIQTLTDLQKFAEACKTNSFMGQTIKLAADITVNSGKATDWAEGKNLPTSSWTPIKIFAGTFDGSGHTITGLYINNNASDYMGLFRQTTDTAVIKNLKITNSYFKSTAGNGMGVIVGYGGGSYQNIYTDVIMHSGINNVGGIMGYNYSSAGKVTVFEGCWSNSDITTSKFKAGGILGNGVSRGFAIRNCMNSGNIHYSSTSGNEYVAGILGSGGGNWSEASTWVIENCLNVGSITTASSVGQIGAILGEGNTNPSSISNLYYLNTSASKGIGADPSSYYANKTTAITENNLKGNSAKESCVGFDFKNVWTTVEGGAPVLREFAEFSTYVLFD